MRISRIYVPSTLDADNSITLSKESSHYLSNVLRLQGGSPLIVFNGKGGEYNAEISEIKKRDVTINVKEYADVDNESPLSIHLLQGVSRGEKMDYTIQKATELGVKTITPVITERSIIKMSAERWLKKIEHWRGVAISACEQCGRNILPEINEPIEFRSIINAVSSDENDALIILHPGGTSLKIVISKAPRRVTVLIGAEGGFSETELANAISSGFVPVAIGPRILRTETAGAAIISALQSNWGDF